MTKVFLDTNVALDFLLRRPLFVQDAADICALTQTGDVCLFLSALSFSNMAYILRKDMQREAIYASMESLRIIANVSPVGQGELDAALALRARDFEDALQYYSALSVGADCIVTRNKKDYAFAEIPVMTPSEFLQTNWP